MSVYSFDAKDGSERESEFLVEAGVDDRIESTVRVAEPRDPVLQPTASRENQSESAAELNQETNTHRGRSFKMKALETYIAK